MRHEVERRTYGVVELRAQEGDESAGKKKPPKMEGYAALFGVKSEEIFGFREVILPGAFDRALREAHDVRALVNHNPDLILGRTKAGTLTLSIDKKGLRAEIDPPDTVVGRDAVTSVERGDLTQMSFAFRVLTDQWRTEEGAELREIVDLELFDVSVVAYPAYLETDVQVSSLARQQAEARALSTKSAAPVVDGAPPAEPEKVVSPDPPADPPAESGAAHSINEARHRLSALVIALLTLLPLASVPVQSEAAVVEAIAGTLSIPPVNLSSEQTGNADSTNTLDRGALRGSALLKVTTTVGSTPTVTVNIQGSMDGTNFYNVAYSLSSTPETVAVAAITITTATTNYYIPRPGHPWRYLKLVYSANTNVTLTVDVWPNRD